MGGLNPSDMTPSICNIAPHQATNLNNCVRHPAVIAAVNNNTNNANIFIIFGLPAWIELFTSMQSVSQTKLEYQNKCNTHSKKKNLFVYFVPFKPFYPLNHFTLYTFITVRKHTTKVTRQSASLSSTLSPML